VGTVERLAGMPEHRYPKITLMLVSFVASCGPLCSQRRSGSLSRSSFSKSKSSIRTVKFMDTTPQFQRCSNHQTRDGAVSCYHFASGAHGANHFQIASNRAGDTGAESAKDSVPDFSILPRPHIVRKKEEVHVELCHECDRMASGHCECGLAVCGAHRYSSDGERNPYGMCRKCQKEISGDMDISAEMVRNIVGGGK
jgi:hypothetical protein